jgi:tRNA pseudouridine55 synthase
VRTAPVPPVDDDILSAAAHRFTGEYTQTPPMYSALKQGGVPLYRLARKGIEVERESRTVRISSLRLKRAAADTLEFDVTCSKGTYVRVLAEDLGSSLGTVAHLSTLRRTRFGRFDLSRAVNLEAASADPQPGVIPVREALSDLPLLRLDWKGAAAARQGRASVLRAATGEGDLLALLDPDDEVAAVLVRRVGRWEFGRVLGVSPGPKALQPDTPVVTDQD